MKVNFTLSNIEDEVDIGRIIDLANQIIKSYNDNSLKHGEFMVIKYNDSREYNVKITTDGKIISIHRTQ